jgi:hypothetical protein
MDAFYQAAKEKERELLAKLEESPIFRQLESLRKYIASYEASGEDFSVNGHTPQTVNQEIAVTYNPNELSWKGRVKFVVSKLGNAGVADIIKEIQRLEPNAHDKAFLDKRVGVTVSQLKKDEKLGVKVVNKKNKYFIR